MVMMITMAIQILLPKQMMHSFEDMFHISIPYYVVVNQTAFKKTNDVLGNQMLGDKKRIISRRKQTIA